MDALNSLVIRSTPAGTEVVVAGHDLTEQTQAINLDVGPDGIAYASVHTRGPLPDVDVIGKIVISDVEAVVRWLSSVDISQVRELIPAGGGMAGPDPVVGTIGALVELASRGLE